MLAFPYRRRWAVILTFTYSYMSLSSLTQPNGSLNVNEVMTSSVKNCIVFAKSIGLSSDPTLIYFHFIRSNKDHKTRSMSSSRSGLSLPEYYLNEGVS